MVVNFIPVGKVISFKDGEVHAIAIDGTEIALVRSGNEFYALEDRCTHDDYPLSDGYVQDASICCKMHGAEFDLKTGAVLKPPAFEDVKTYRVRINKGMVEIEIDQDL